MPNLDLFPFFISLCTLAVIVLTVAVLNRNNYLATFIIIPTALASCFVAYFTVSSLLGFPVVGTIPEGSLYLSHVESIDKQSIFVWVVVPKSEKPKAIQIPNSNQNRKNMNGADEKSAAGVPQLVGEEQGAPGDYIVYDFVVQDNGAKAEAQN